MNTYTLIPAIFLSILSALLSDLVAVQAAEQEGARPGEGTPSGIITGLTGERAIATASDRISSRSLTLGEKIMGGEDIRTGEGKVEILWGGRGLVVIHEHSQVNIVEPLLGQTVLHLGKGTVRVAHSFSAGRPMDVLTVQTTTARVMTRGGILEMSVTSPRGESLFARLGDAVARSVSDMLPEGAMRVSAPVETVRILEGQARIEPLGSGMTSSLLQAGSEVRLLGGTVSTVSELTAAGGKADTLPATDQHRVTPKLVTKQIVGRHVEHALEVERLLRQPPPVEIDKEAAGPNVRGAIVSTSLGVPVASFSQTSTAGGAQSAGSQSPPTVVFTPTSPSGSMPAATSPPIATPNVTTLTTTQSGGLNTSAFLQNIFTERDDDHGKGKGKKN